MKSVLLSVLVGLMSLNAVADQILYCTSTKGRVTINLDKKFALTPFYNFSVPLVPYPTSRQGVDLWTSEVFSDDTKVNFLIPRSILGDDTNGQVKIRLPMYHLTSVSNRKEETIPLYCSSSVQLMPQ